MWYFWLLVFFDKGFQYDLYLCNGCHDLMQRAMKWNDVAIVPVKKINYRIHFWYINKDDVIYIIKN